MEYPNARASGLADPDTDLVDRIVAHLSETPLRERAMQGVKGIELDVLAHFMASYLLVDQLIVGRREHDKMDWQDEAYTQALGQQMASGLIIALAAYSGLSRELVAPFVQNSGVDWQCLAGKCPFGCATIRKDMCHMLKNVVFHPVSTT